LRANRFDSGSDTTTASSSGSSAGGTVKDSLCSGTDKDSPRSGAMSASAPPMLFPVWSDGGSMS
jgi:hypothetical protein